MLPEVPRYFVRTTISRAPCRKALFNDKQRAIPTAKFFPE